MNGSIGNTDPAWHRFLFEQQGVALGDGLEGLDEVNFWTPSGRAFRSRQPGEPFFFRLKAPINAIGGFGFFSGIESNGS
jgi:putative restriction endonuclease